MRPIVSTVGSIATGIVVCVGLILLAIYPHRPGGILGWIVLVLVAIPIVLGLEVIGTYLLQHRIVTGMGRVARILYGIIAILMISAIVALGWNWIAPHLDTW